MTGKTGRPIGTDIDGRINGNRDGFIQNGALVIEFEKDDNFMIFSHMNLKRYRMDYTRNVQL